MQLRCCLIVVEIQLAASGQALITSDGEAVLVWINSSLL